MEFQFNVNEYFKEPIVEIRNTLLPPDFAGDRRALWNTVNKVAEVVNEMGEASAHAQGLSKPITTAERLRQSDQSLYLLVDKEDNNGNGAVTGMLKVGRKGLYVFDREGQHYQVTPPCVLDFYIHEKKQRSGLGKKLFEHMLEKEKVQPHNLAIDRPSDKFLNFLRKYYSLEAPIKQMNNYVVFDGFFPSYRRDDQSEKSPVNRTNGLQSTFPHNTPSYGRYGAPRPPCSMGQIIHNTSSQKNTEPASPSKLPRQQETSAVIPREQIKFDQMRNPVNDRYELQQANMLSQTPQHQELTFNKSQLPEIQNNTEQIATKMEQNYQTNELQQRFNQKVQPQQPIQEQVRMFPERETQAISTSYQDQPYCNSLYQPRQYSNTPPTPQNSSVIITNMHHVAGAPSMQPNSLSVPVSQHSLNVPTIQQNLPPSNIWSSQLQPQQMCQMTHLPLSTPFVQPQNQVAQLPYPQQVLLPQPMNPNSFQFLQYPQVAHQGATSYISHPFQIPQQHLITQPHLQQLDRWSSHQSEVQNQYNQPVSYQTHMVASVPQMVMAEHCHQQPLETLPNVQQLVYKQQVPQNLITSAPYQHQQPHPYQQRYLPTSVQETQQSRPVTQDSLVPQDSEHQRGEDVPRQEEKEKRDSGKDLKEDSVRALLHIDPKYFKSDPIQLKQPNPSLVNSPQGPRQMPKNEDTVASLLKAEQEFFENGVLREKYRSLGTCENMTRQDIHQNYQQVDSNTKHLQNEQYVMHPQEIRKHQQYNNLQFEQFPQENRITHRLVDDSYFNRKPLTISAEQHFQQEPPPQQQYTTNQNNKLQPQFLAQQQLTHTQHTPPLPQQLMVAQSASNVLTSNMLQNAPLGESQSQSRVPTPPADQTPDIVQYRTETIPETEKTNVEQQYKKVENNLETATTTEKVQAEYALDPPHPETPIRQSSYIANDFNPYAEGPGRVSSNTKLQTSSNNTGRHKKGLSKQYGLNDSDIRRKAYKSAIIRRTPDTLEHDSLEFGYPPQVVRKRPPPRTILTMRAR